MRSQMLATAFALTALVTFACSSGDGGISIGAACDTFCDRFVDCTVTDPANEDNVYNACMTSCEDLVVAVETANNDVKDCQQAYRQYTRCLGAEASCAELASEMPSDQTCRSELFDVAEFCPAT